MIRDAYRKHVRRLCCTSSSHVDFGTHFCIKCELRFTCQMRSDNQAVADGWRRMTYPWSVVHPVTPRSALRLRMICLVASIYNPVARLYI
jgi:hypothetical protein